MLGEASQIAAGDEYFGLTVKLGSRMVDSSLRTKLNAIKHAMKEAG